MKESPKKFIELKPKVQKDPKALKEPKEIKDAKQKQERPKSNAKEPVKRSYASRLVKEGSENKRRKKEDSKPAEVHKDGL